MKIPPPLLSSVRISSVLALCWLSYQAGQVVQALQDEAAGRIAVVYVERGQVPRAAGGIAPGGVVGEPQDVVTPLNVRDPAALVMAPDHALPKRDKPEARLYPRVRDAEKNPNF